MNGAILNKKYLIMKKILLAFATSLVCVITLHYLGVNSFIQGWIGCSIFCFYTFIKP